MGDLATGIQQAWTNFLGIVNAIVSPDWNALVLLIPIGVVLLVALYLVATTGAWGLASIVRPHARVRYEAGSRALPRGAGGSLEPPLGLPFSLRAGLVYPYGTQRTDDGEDLTLICPKCRIQRPAALEACANCGLILRFNRSLQIAPPAGPPPGGAAAA